MRGGDAARGGVVVGAEMRGDDAPAAFADEPRQRDAAIGAENRLRRLDHQLEAQRAGRQLAPVLEGVARRRERRDLFGRRHLRQRDDEVVRHRRRSVRSTQPREEQIERAQAAPLQLFVQRLDPDADPGRQRARRQRGRHFVGRRLRDAILFLVRPVAEAVLEIDAEVLDRLARQLVDDAEVDAIGQRRVQAERAGERRRRRAHAPAATRNASAPSFCAASALNRCAPP